MTTPFRFVSAILLLSVIVQGRPQIKLADVAVTVPIEAVNNIAGRGQGAGAKKCSIQNLKITQAKTGIEVVGQSTQQAPASDVKIPEWEVTVLNDCPCKQSKVKVSCANFQTLEYINPFIFNATVPAAECFLNDGLPIEPRSDLTFTYACNQKPYPFKPISSDVAC